MRIWEAMAISVGSGSYTKWDSYTQSTQIHQPHPHAHLSMFSYLLHRFIIKIRCRWSQKAFATKWLPSGHHHFQYQCWPEQEQEEAKWSRSNSTENPAEHFIGDEIKYTIINLCPCVFFSRLEGIWMTRRRFTFPNIISRAALWSWGFDYVSSFD